MKAITLTLQTKQPILATSFQGDPNSDVSYSYIPGSMIRGAIIGRYMRQHHLPELDLTNEEVKRLFFEANSTRYLNAYLLSYEKQPQRTLPLPLCWFKDKDAELKDDSPITVYDFSIDRRDDPETPKSVGEYFWRKERGEVKLYKDKRRINIHNFRDRQKGRSTDNQGELFRYDALDAGQKFQSVILCEDGDEITLQMLLVTEPNIWLGGSQSAGYGHTKIINLEILDRWDEIGVPAEEREDNDELLNITLLSDTLLRNEYGQPVADPMLIKQAVEEVLNISLPEPSNIFAGSTLIGGFNRKWGLPLPQVPALAAGSAIVFEGIEINESQIKQLEAYGIGERREDGFGRIAVNWLQDEKFTVSLPRLSSTSSLPPLTKKSSYLAEQMAQRLLEQKLEDYLQKEVGSLKLDDAISNNGISNSQLSRLQSAARQGLPNGDCNLVISLLNNLPSNAKSQFDRTKIGDKSFRLQLDEWLEHPTDWIHGIEVKIAGVERRFDDDRAKEDKLAQKYTLRLIMAVAKKATKEKN